jgi:hypothetical protein
VGLVPNTNAPDPVSSVTALAKLALLGVANHVATPEPNPDTPVDIGNPVQFVSVPEVGVPNTGVVNVGEVANTNDPLPVSSVIADAKLAELGVPSHVATPAPNEVIPVPPFPAGNVLITSAVKSIFDILLPVAFASNVLLVNVSVVALPTRVSVASGNVNVLLSVCDVLSVNFLAVVAPEVLNTKSLVVSPPCSALTSNASAALGNVSVMSELGELLDIEVLLPN